MVSKVCLTCGSDHMADGLLVYCDKCNEYGQHLYCFGVSVYRALEPDFTWCCEECSGVEPPLSFSYAEDDVLVTEEVVPQSAGGDDVCPPDSEQERDFHKSVLGKRKSEDAEFEEVGGYDSDGETSPADPGVDSNQNLKVKETKPRRKKRKRITMPRYKKKKT